MTSKSAEKQTRVASRRQQRNKSVRSEVKTNITKAEKLIFAGEMKEAQKAVAIAVSALERPVNGSGVCHRHHGDRS